MLLLSKAISQLLLPPGGLILISAIGLIFWKKVWGRSLLALALCMLWLLSTEPVRDILTENLEFQHLALHIEQFKTKQAAIVLLGGGLQKNAPDYQGDTLSSSSMMRTIYAAKIAKRTGLKVYTTGGTPLSQTIETEGNVMKRWLVWFGIPEQRIVSENQANTTWENAVFSKQLLDKENLDHVILVTSAWHMPRAVWCFEAQGLTVIPAPTDYLTEQGSYDLRSFLPRWDVLGDSGQALHEYLGLLFYWIKY